MNTRFKRMAQGKRLIPGISVVVGGLALARLVDACPFGACPSRRPLGETPGAFDAHAVVGLAIGGSSRGLRYSALNRTLTERIEQLRQEPTFLQGDTRQRLARCGAYSWPRVALR